MKYLLLFLSLQCFAYIPTVESLLSNSSNIDIHGYMVEANFKLINLESKSPFYFKMMTYKGNQSSAVQYTQVSFNEKGFGELNTTEVVKGRSLKNESRLTGLENVEKSVFYSILNMLMANNPHHIMKVFKENGASVAANSQLLNREKTGLMSQFRSYFSRLKGKSAASSNIRHPLKHRDEETRKRVNGVYFSNLYKSNDSVSIKKDGRDFIYLVKKGSLEFKVNSKRHMKKIKLDSRVGKIQADFKNYVLVNGSQEFPRRIIFNFAQAGSFALEIIKLNYTKSNQLSFTQKSSSFSTQANMSQVKPVILL